tara:strand:- start:876 stop:1094 length:219 start_codon:yes stop_codon:yes gene_type:complete
MTRQLNPGIIAYNNINSITLEEEKVGPTSKGLLSPNFPNKKKKVKVLDENERIATYVSAIRKEREELKNGSS